MYEFQHYSYIDIRDDILFHRFCFGVVYRCSVTLEIRKIEKTAFKEAPCGIQLGIIVPIGRISY